DLQNLAGWTTFDIGLLDASRNHFGTALELAKESGDHGLMSNVLYRMGRVYLHHDSADEALKIFQLGQIAAQDSGSELAVAVLCANEAWAYARMGKHELAVKLLGRARDELSRATLDEAPDWAKFFDQNDLSAMIGTVYTELSKTDVKHTAIAIPALTTALAGYTEEMARSRAFNLSALATNLLRQGEVDHGVRVGREAFGMAITLKSARVVDRLEAVEIEAARRAASSDARDLSVHIRRLRVRTD
ncbi:MAG: ELYS family protein, partial [Actinomycetota bacterium]|nr:ELYS family protein [Actinomycetota bacterium]